MNRYTFKDGRYLRCGYTTGTCAAAAAQAAAFLLLKQILPEKKTDNAMMKDGCVSLFLPGGTEVTLPFRQSAQDGAQRVPEEGAAGAENEKCGGRRKNETFSVCCAVRKDAGDDADVTDGMEILASVSLCEEKDIIICGGEGVGRVTRPGLDRPPGDAAINTVPRQMIRDAVDRVRSLYGYEGGIRVEISVPGGREAAEKTMNPALGIEGGISILGTSGIVEPMSDAAVVETIRAEMRMKIGTRKCLAAVPGNYGLKFSEKYLRLPSEKIIRCSNFIGDTLDAACEYGLTGLILAGNAGKFIKLASGIMNTHSSEADARIETVIACSLEAGASIGILKRLQDCITTEAAFSLLCECGLAHKTLDIAAERAQRYVQRRVRGRVVTGIVIFSSESGLISSAGEVREILDRIREEG